MRCSKACKFATRRREAADGVACFFGAGVASGVMKVWLPFASTSSPAPEKCESMP